MLKKSFAELFYITLLISALRPPDNSLLYPRESNFWFGQSDTFGPITAEHFNTGYRYPGLLYNDFHLNSKSNILLHETLDVLEEINSLGRYSQPLHNSRLFAYPVSSNSDETVQSNGEINESVPSPDLTSDDLFAQFENVNFNDLDSNIFDLDEDFLLGNDSNSISLPGENGATQTARADAESIGVDDLLANSSVMFPTLDSTNGDVNDLFGELELLLSNETDNFGQEWQNFYTPITSTDTVEYPPIYDPNNIATDVRNIENCAIYENGSANGQNVANPTGSFSNNFGAVLYSSLTTLSNGTEHLNTEIPASTNLVYNSSEINDLAYMSNLSNVSINNVTNSECFYNSYIPEEEFNLSDVNAIANTQYTNYPNGQTNYSSQEAPIGPANHSQFMTATTEDCFDKSSDSAVSSMSSDRVHSYSDNDWAETSSESSSYNGEANISDYQNNENKCNNAAAQKKYRLFGKNKNGDFKNSTQVSNYYADYPQVNFTYSNSCPPNTNENYNQLNYYQSTVSHNHTYSQSQLEVVAPLSSMSSNIPTSDWSASESFDDSDANKKPETSRSTKSNSKRQQINIENIRKDPHLNRDEKRARSLKIPISTQDIINLPIDEFNERLTKYDLTEIQLSLIRDIRRRGKNKVAAQNCRKRKLDQIMGLQSEVDNMFTRKSTLEAQYNELLMLRELARDKYTKLYQFVVEASSSQQPFFDLTTSPPDFPDKDSSADVQLNDNGNNSFMVSNNISSPVHLSSYGVQNNFNKQD